MAARGTSRVSRIFEIWPRLRVRRKVPGLRVRRDFSRSLPGPLFGALAILAVFGRPCDAPRDPDRPLAECSSSPCDNGAECYDSLDAPLAYRHINFQPPGTETPDGYLADEGQLYGVRPNGLRYGWNCALDMSESLTIDGRRSYDEARSIRPVYLVVPRGPLMPVDTGGAEIVPVGLR